MTFNDTAIIPQIESEIKGCFGRAYNKRKKGRRTCTSPFLIAWSCRMLDAVSQATPSGKPLDDLYQLDVKGQILPGERVVAVQRHV